MKVKVLVLGFLFMVFGVSGASAVTFTMQEDDYNQDGSVKFLAVPYNFGSVTWTASFNTPGAHYYIKFIDPEIDQGINTFFNEYGGVVGAPVAGQSWEIDEPGYVYGNIYSNFVAGALDNSYGLPAGSFDDVSMALGWNFILAPGETAALTFTITPNQPASGFYLVQTDPDSQANLYFYSTLNIQGGGEPPIPEPATMLLLGSGLVGLAGLGRKRLFKK